MATDLGGLARLFNINFAPSFHYQLPNPYGIRTGTELQPIGQGAGVLANTRTVGPAGGVPVYYSNGFLPAGGGQTSGGGGLLSAITAGLNTFLPAIFGGGGGAVARTPPIIPTAPKMTVPTAITKTMGGIVSAANQHPVLTAAGGAAATAGAAIAAARTLRGHKVVQTAAGPMIMRHHRRMNPCNIHALRRGLRRASAFERIAKRVLHITSPRKHVSGFKLPHRRKK